MRTAIPKLHFVQPMPEMLYCGCHKQTGHYFWVQGMINHDNWGDPNHTQYCKLDNDFCPQDTCENGQAWFHSEPAYSVVSFWDNSIDSRPGSHSTFLLVGPPLCFTDALEKCKKAFPEVFARFRFLVSLRRNCFMPEVKA